MHAIWPKLSSKLISTQKGQTNRVHPNNIVVIRPISAFIQLQYTLYDEKSDFSLESLFFVWINFTFTIFFCIFSQNLNLETEQETIWVRKYSSYYCFSLFSWVWSLNKKEQISSMAKIFLLISSFMQFLN